MARREQRGVPQAERRYEHQIPSRDEISRMMESLGAPLTLEALGARFEIRTEQHLRALEQRLKAMVRDGQLIRNRAGEFLLTGHLDLVTGTVLAFPVSVSYSRIAPSCSQTIAPGAAVADLNSNPLFGIA